MAKSPASRKLWLVPPRAHVIDRDLNDEESTGQTIDWMRRHTLEDFRSAAVRSAAAAATRGRQTPAQAAAGIFEWIKSRIRFRRDSETALIAGLDDPSQAEVLIRPVDLLAMDQPAEDCDGFAMLTAAMLLAAGIQPEWVTIEADPRFPGQYSHIYTRAVLPDGRLAMDTSHGPRPGWEAPATGKKRTWSMRTGLGEGTSFWQEIFKQGANTGLTILSNRYGQPPPSYQETGPYGTVTIRGGGAPSTPGYTGMSPIGGSVSPLLLMGGLAIGGLLIVSMLARK